MGSASTDDNASWKRVLVGAWAPLPLLPPEVDESNALRGVFHIEITAGSLSAPAADHHKIRILAPLL